MPSERVQRRIDRLLDQAEDAADQRDWPVVLECVASVLALDAANEDAAAFQEMATAGQQQTSRRPDESPAPAPSSPTVQGPGPSSDTPKSFANGRYKVQKFLGEGGKKRVYQAHDTLLDREVAFALIKTEGFDQTSKERISREAQAMGRLGVHPNIVAVLDLGQEDDGSPYMVTELMGGGDVEGLLEEAEESRLSLERTIEIGKAVCAGLEFAHARGIVHRDLKPGNVWLTEDGIAKIGDFGLAVMTDRSRLTREGMMVGTVSYMPPEQATGGEITPRADLYSLGAMLYEMVTGRPPFLGDDEIAIIGQHINTPPVAPTWHNGTCPRPLEALIMRLLAKDPSERPESAQDVFNALDAIDLAARGETVEREANSLESLAGGVFVGRQGEMDQLKAALEDVLGGRGRLGTLVGEPGIGKTRTCEELATYAGLRGAKVLWGRCYEGGGAPPYWPWVQAIRSYVREIDPDELRRQMGSSASVVAEIVTDVKDRLPELQSPPQMDDPESARFRLFDSITSFLRTASQSQPLVIVLDDLHWSDQPSLAFLEFIARELNQSRVLLLCTYRDMELNRRHQLTVTLGDLARDRLYERVILRGLTENDIARFVEIAAGFAAPRELSATVHRHTEGNPLFVTEVIRDLVQSGELTEEKVTGRSTWSVRIPEGVREVIGRRLDRLSDRANETLTTAAVIGRGFSLDALKLLVEDTTEGQLLDVLDEALDGKLIEEQPDEIGRYQFTHALIQETLTGELSAARKVRIHASVAGALEDLYGDASEEHAAELVPHFAEAEPVLGDEKLIHYSIIAGEDSLETYAPEDALVHFERAFDAWAGREMDDEGARLLWGLGLARSAAAAEGEFQAAWDTLARAFDYYYETGDADAAIKIAIGQISIRVLVRGPAEVLERSLGLVQPGSIEAARVMTLLSEAIWLENGDEERARELADKAVEIARERDDVALEKDMLMQWAGVVVLSGRDAEGAAMFQAVDDLAPADSNPYQELIAAVVHGQARMSIGEPDRAAELYTLAWQAAERLGGNRNRAVVIPRPACLALLLGDWAQADALLESWQAVHSSALRFVRVWLDGQLGRPETEVDFSDIVRGEWDNAVWTSSLGLALAFAASTRQDASRRADIAVIIRQGLTWLANDERSLSLRLHIGKSLSAAVAMLTEEADVETLQAAYSSLEPQRGTASPFFVATDRMLGRLAITLGRPDDATMHFEDALEFCRNAGYRPELAWTCSDYAEMLLDRDEPGDREKAIELQDEALVITQELGMRPLTERILARREILRA